MTLYMLFDNEEIFSEQFILKCAHREENFIEYIVIECYVSTSILVVSIELQMCLSWQRSQTGCINKLFVDYDLIQG
ncbi:unnamed protein product [Rotaria socialis]